MTKTGRNDPCPCGSGLKYKKCCLRQAEQDAARHREKFSAVPRALDWLDKHYAEELAEAIHTQYYGDPPEEEFDALNALPEDLQEMVQVNICEWILTDAHIPVEGEMRAVREVVLGPGGPLLGAVGKDWLRRIGERHLSLYEVQEVQPGQAIRLLDLLHPDKPSVWVEEKAASQNLARYDIFGARLVSENEGWVLSGAVYPFSREKGLACRDEIFQERANEDWGTQLARETIGGLITLNWLDSLISQHAMPELVDASTGEPILGTSDHYRVTDPQALVAILAKQPDVEGSEEEGWVRFTEFDEERNRLLANLNLKNPQTLEVFCRTLEYADETRFWLEKIAGKVLRYQIREIADPTSAKAREDAPESRSLAIAPEKREEIMRNFYANWTEEPIPALGDKTPRQAIRSAHGRQAVIELLKTYEHHEEHEAREWGRRPFDFGFLWESLGLSGENER